MTTRSSCDRPNASPVRFSSFAQGVLDALPIAVGYFPIAVGFGALGAGYGADFWFCVGLSVFVFAGASQFISLGLIAGGAGLAQIIIATFFINSRHAIMSMSLKVKMEEKKGFGVKLLSFFITDETFALVSPKKELKPFYFAGVGITAYLSWNFGTMAGYVFESFIPENVVGIFSAILYALFIALTVPEIKKHVYGFSACALSVFLGCVFYFWLGGSWSVILTTILVTIAMGFLDSRRKTDAGESPPSEENGLFT